MGCDGGTIPKRDELVRTKKKSEQKDKVAELAFLWRHCSISQTQLRNPVVACGLGKLYNKDSVIMGVLDKSTLPESAKHIRSIKDVKELNLTANPAFVRSVDKGDSYIDHQCAPYICPVIGLEMNGKFKFCFYWSCGCVVSERAIKEIKSNNCHKCGCSVAESDLVILNATDDDLQLNRVRMEARIARQKAEKKKKKEEVKSEKSETTNGVEESKDTKLVDQKTVGPSTTKTVTSKPVEKNGVKRPAVGLGMQTSDFKKTKGDYSVAKDPSASTVYKSLFTSSKEAKNQTKAHWITYNPFYN
ncbi:hypothetical protein O3M35_001984 [Rhynocoris fuscipes]|uniref:Replication termination factor 2 n=1 Tax=Rhynocoris fuscipes TaxID=488301 RepID=A0AAW1CPF1_9HEMI